MLNKRLISLHKSAMRGVAQTVLYNWLGLICNVAFVVSLSHLVGYLFSSALDGRIFAAALSLCAATIPLRWLCTTAGAAASHRASDTVKGTLRERIYSKAAALGTSYAGVCSTSQIVMLASEGVEQIDVYFSKYLPQLFYSLAAPLTLFFFLAPVHLRSASILLACVPLIPVSIVAVQKFAKKLLARYWGAYTTLGDCFLENLQGLTTLKIYQADAYKNRQMNAQAERFRKITMKVLTMQLNSVTVMDLLAYGGAGLGIGSAVLALAARQISLTACLILILLAADFFLPLRLLGSYFHIAMNGAASADKIFALLDAPVPADGAQTAQSGALALCEVDFCYEVQRPILHKLSLTFAPGSFTALVGESGCGKSTVAGLLCGALAAQRGSVTLGGVTLDRFSRDSLAGVVTRVPHDAVLLKGTVRSNLCLAAPDASENALWAVLEQVNLAAFCRAAQGLDTPVCEAASNLSGGQRQRLAMARALLHDTPVYLFDEATSNIDATSENDIMAAIRALAGRKTVILISHRLANAAPCERIYVLEQGALREQGTHAQLMAKRGVYHRLYCAQKELESYGGTSA